MAIDLDKELLKALDPEASSERIQGLALKAVQEAASAPLKEGLAKQANIGKVKAFMAQGMGAAEAVKKAYPGWSDEQVQALASKLGGQSKAPSGADRLREALLQKGREKTAEAGTGAALGSLAGSFVPGASLVTGPIGAALGAHIGKTPAQKKRRDPEKASPEARAALGDFLGRLGGLGVGAGVGGALGAGVGASLPIALKKELRHALAMKSTKGLSPRAAAMLGLGTAGGMLGGVLGSGAGGAYGASRGAKSSFKEKESSVLLGGLKYASAASYQTYMEKNARIGGFLRSAKDAFFGGLPVAGTLGGAAVGGLAGGARKASQIFDLNKALAQNRGNVDKAFKSFHGAEDYAKFKDLSRLQRSQEERLKVFDKADPATRGSVTRESIEAAPPLSKADSAWLRSAEQDMSQLKRLKKLQGADVQGFDKALGYMKEFAPDVLKQVGVGGAIGGVGGAALQEGGRAMVRSKVRDLGKSVLPVVGAGVGGVALGSVLS